MRKPHYYWAAFNMSNQTTTSQKRELALMWSSRLDSTEGLRTFGYKSLLEKASRLLWPVSEGGWKNSQGGERWCCEGDFSQSAPIGSPTDFLFIHTTAAFLITVILSICHIFVSDKYTIPHTLGLGKVKRPLISIFPRLRLSTNLEEEGHIEFEGRLQNGVGWRWKLNFHTDNWCQSSIENMVILTIAPVAASSQ